MVVHPRVDVVDVVDDVDGPGPGLGNPSKGMILAGDQGLGNLSAMARKSLTPQLRRPERGAKTEADSRADS